MDFLLLVVKGKLYILTYKLKISLILKGIIGSFSRNI